VTFTRTWAIIVGVITAVAGLLAIASEWETVERFLDWFYPLPLLISLCLALLGVTALFVRERGRTTPKTMREVSAEQKESREQWKVDARRTITLILNEVASNRRIAENSLSRGALTRARN
jgi:H+/Cl- antiporter ClcA